MAPLDHETITARLHRAIRDGEITHPASLIDDVAQTEKEAALAVLLPQVLATADGMATGLGAIATRLGETSSEARDEALAALAMDAATEWRAVREQLWGALHSVVPG